MKVGYFAPLPPAPTGVADYAETLVQVVSHASEPAAMAIAAGLTGSQPPSEHESQPNGS